MIKMNVIDFNSYQKSTIRKTLLKKAKQRYSAQLGNQLRREGSNDNNIVVLALKNDSLKV